MCKHRYLPMTEQDRRRCWKPSASQSVEELFEDIPADSPISEDD